MVHGVRGKGVEVDGKRLFRSQRHVQAEAFRQMGSCNCSIARGRAALLLLLDKRYDFDTSQGAYFKMMQVALLQLLAAVNLAILSAGVGFRLDT